MPRPSPPGSRKPAPVPTSAPVTAPAAERTDECIYCGKDNGPVDPETGRGVSRIGFDCFWCGSN